MRKDVLIFILFCPILAAAQIEMEPAEDGILFTEKGKKIFFYQIEPKSVHGEYRRSNYFHPLWSPDGHIISEDFPEDHLHHRGIFWAWHQVTVGGRDAGDLWELKGIVQEVEEVEFMVLPSGAGQFRTEVFWKSENGPAKGIPGPFLKEQANITIHPGNATYRRIDFQITLMAMKDGVQLGGSNDEKGYGGFSVRLKMPASVSFNGPQGPVVPTVNQVAAPGWINIAGKEIDGKKQYGITILDNLQNPGYPQSWILRKERSMQNIVYPGRVPVDISRNEPLVLRYSLLVHNGKLKNRLITRELSK